MSIESSICNAIDLIVQQAVSKASYDKTIKAIISECVDSSVGKYTVKYQDAVFYAYSQSTDTTYTNGTSVWVLVPGNDMSQTKTILGTVTKLGTDYISVTEDKDNYEINGINCIVSSTTEYGLKSYLDSSSMEDNVIVLYSRDDDINLIGLDTIAVEQYLKSSDYVYCGVNARTELPSEQQAQGNYGIIFALDFLDTSTGEAITRYFIIDVDNMEGNPYKFVTATYQYGVFPNDPDNFIDVNYISLFCYDFPYSKDESECVEDIFLSGFELCGANLIEQDDNGYSLIINTPSGRYFSSNSASSDARSLKADFRVNGTSITSDLTYYWFIENTSITTKSIYYNKYGGQGWKCLNDYEVVSSSEDGEPESVEWINGNDTYTVVKSDLYTSSATYKLVVIYAGVSITRTVEIINLDAEYSLSIESDAGTQFYYNQGSPTLTCLVNNEENTDLTYIWSVTDIYGNYSSLSETTDLNTVYEETIDEYNQLLQDIKSGAVLLTASQEKLTSLQEQIVIYEETTRVLGHIVYSVDIGSIVTSSTYKCGVFAGDTYLGTASIVLYNILATEGNYSLILNNGSYTYKYNESGVSPTSESLESPLVIPELSFVIYDNLGVELSDAAMKYCNVTWIVPNEDSMIEIPSGYTPTSSADGYDYYTGLSTLAYTIADVFDASKINNNIQLIAQYQDVVLTAITNFNFIKEGYSGTNGTEFSCKIVPNNDSFTDLPFVTEYADGSYGWNFAPDDDDVYFKIQFYHNENLIYDGTKTGTSSEGKVISISWTVLRNKYTSTRRDSSDFTISASSGTVSFSGYSGSMNELAALQSYPANIIEATIKYDSVVYYATLPILTAVVKDDSYGLSLKENTGFTYAVYTTDGQSPQYSTAKPFEIIVTKIIDGYVEDISTVEGDYKVEYTWSYLGSVYSNSVDSFIESVHLDENLSYSGELAKNQMAVKPDDSFDGECVSNAVEVIIWNTSDEEVARIHIPVHLYLNRYGQAALNSWDGNQITINEDGGYILAPQVGAGYKEEDNSFTGVLMGQVRESGSDVTEAGLFGYYQGVRTIFLDASTGAAYFGAEGAGQIIIDPTNNIAQIYSGNYDEDAGTGLLIDLTTPEIRYGSGNFSVDANGIVHMTGAVISGYSTTEDLDSLKEQTVSSVEIYYAVSDSKTDPPESGWQTTQPIPEQGQYVWSHTIVTYADGVTTSESYMVMVLNEATSVVSITHYYAVSNSSESAPTEGWTTDPTEATLSASNKYLWNYEVVLYGDGSTSESPAAIIGVYGDTGTSLYTWIKFASDLEGSDMSDDPTGKFYIGLSYNNTTATESDDPSDYTWSLFRGSDGVDGESGYTWIKFAVDEEGTGISDDPTNRSYIGFAYNKTTQEESDDPADYVWTLYKGSDGVDGISYSIESSNGYIYSDTISTTLTARIYQGFNEIDADGDELTYEWYIKDSDDEDYIYYGSGKTIELSIAESYATMYFTASGE